MKYGAVSLDASSARGFHDCASPPAHMSISHRGICAFGCGNLAPLTTRRGSTRPVASAPCTANTLFAKSVPAASSPLTALLPWGRGLATLEKLAITHCAVTVSRPGRKESRSSDTQCYKHSNHRGAPVGKISLIGAILMSHRAGPKRVCMRIGYGRCLLASAAAASRTVRWH